MFQIKNGLNKMNASTLLKSILAFCSQKYKVVFFAVFFGLCVWGIFLWYYSLYYFHWDDQQKQAYISEQSPRTMLDTDNFETVLHTIDHRNSVYRSEPVAVKNIFATDQK